jgi:prepilin-type N-terminal cleavage/methylation domain-containing protein
LLKVVNRSGFTLIELAVVLVIVGIVISIVATVLPSLIQTTKIKKARAILEKVEYTLEGYFAANGQCPCPDTDGDGLENRITGATPPADDTCSAYVGYLPYRTLGLSSGEDNWRNPIVYAVYEDLIKTTSGSGSNYFCYRLRDIINYYRTNPTDTGKLYTTDSNGDTNQAYIIVSGGREDLDGSGGFLDGLNSGSDQQFESPNKIMDANYDDLVGAASFSLLHGRDCAGAGGGGGGSGTVENSYPNGCTNGIDDDGDLLKDCSDPDCFGDPACLAGGENVTIATSSVPSGNVESSYSLTFTASGGITPYEWELLNNGGFDDLYLHPYTGNLSGSLSQCPGNYSIQIKVTDSTQPTATSNTQSFDIQVTSDLTVSRTSGAGTDITWSSAAQQETFETNGGHLGDINWQLDTGGATGFIVSSTGTETCVIKKNGSTTANSYTFTLTATDATCANNTAEIILAVTVPSSGAGKPGEISDIIDTYEFETGTCIAPNIIYVSGSVYAIAYRGPGNDGFVKTIEIASDGDITDSVIDTLEFDTVYCINPNIINTSGDIYAIAYRSTGDDGFLKTVEINSSGQITDSIIDTLEFDANYCVTANIINISDDIHAIAYRGPGNDGFLKTVEIDSNGQITDSVVDTLEFDTSTGLEPNILHISGDVYVIAYRGPGSDGFTKTVEIPSSGQITDTVIDTMEYDTSYSVNPSIINSSGDIYAIAYRGVGNDGFLTTIEIDSNGEITNSVIDTLEFETSYCITANIVSVAGEIYAITYRGVDNDGFVITVELDSSGEITDTVVDTLEFDTSNGLEPSIINVSGDVYAIAYRGPGNDGFLKTIQITQ